MKTIIQLIAIGILALATGSFFAHLHANLAPQSPWAEVFHLSWVVPVFGVMALWYYQQPSQHRPADTQGLSLFGLSINPVVGKSLSPDINPGSYVIFHRFFSRNNLNIGDLVKVNHPKLGVIVKHITYIDSNGLLWLRAEDKLSLSTLDMGPIRPQRIIGKTLYVLKAASQKQLLNF